MKKFTPHCMGRYYYNFGARSTRGDMCYHSTGAWECPKGCKTTQGWNTRWWVEPYCVTNDSTSNADMRVCHLHLNGGADKRTGGHCTYIAEPMTYATAQARCAKEYTNGVVCNDLYIKTTDDGKSADWSAIYRFCLLQTLSHQPFCVYRSAYSSVPLLI